MSRWLKVLTVPALFALLALALPSISSAEVHGNVNLFLGMKTLSDGDWEPIEDQPEFGVLTDWGAKEWPIHIAADVLFSSDDEDIGGVDVDGETFELALGVRKVWYQNDRFRPYVGGGLDVVQAEVEFEGSFGSVDDDDTGIGAWVDGGIVWRIGEVFQIGAGLRYSYAEVELFEEDLKAGGLHYGLVAGFGW